MLPSLSGTSNHRPVAPSSGNSCEATLDALAGVRNPLASSLRSPRRGERRLSRRSLGEGGHFSPCYAHLASYDSASQFMHYVYILQSEIDDRRFYTGLTDDLRKRLRDHNAGRVRHSNKWKPWPVKTYIAFSERLRAAEFERYLKSASGRAFIRKRL